MSSEGEILSLLDLLDLDEEVVDIRLKSIMVKTNYTNKHLTIALQLLRYKNLINRQEETECNNTEEFDFVAKLIKDLDADTVDNVCQITSTVLELNTATLVCYSEHLLSQILSNLDVCYGDSKSSELKQSKTLLYLKICDSILNAAIKHDKILSMLFLEVPLEEILSSSNEHLKIHFITSTVPKLAEGMNGYDILGRIWNYLEKLRREYKNTALKVLSSLSDYYLPVTKDGKSTRYESTVIYDHTFWELVLYGLMSDDQLLRKISVYLAKRAIDYVASLKININVKWHETSLFTWSIDKQELYKNNWNNFFILIDSLEEKQSNIVVPSLQLFDTLKLIDNCWLNCAFNLGLKHDNGQIRLKCVQYRINLNINSETEAVVLLRALNDINFYDSQQDCKILKHKLSEVLIKEDNLVHILKAIPQAHLSPVPFYHLTDVVANINMNIDSKKHVNISETIVEILKTSCNIIAIREAIHYNIAHFVGQSCKTVNWHEIVRIYALLHIESLTESNALYTLVKDWKFNDKDKKEFYEYITESYCNIEFGMMYLNNHPEDINMFMEIISMKVKTIEDVINRQYSNKMECFNDALYILTLQNTIDTEFKQLLPHANKTILQYVYSLLSSDVHLNIDETKLLFSRITFTQESNVRDIVIQLYKTAVLLLQDSLTESEKLVQSLLIVNTLTHNHDFVNTFSHEMLDLKQLLKLEAIFSKKAGSNAHSLGRLRNVFYETHCILIRTYLSSIIVKKNSEESSQKTDNTKSLNDNNKQWDETYDAAVEVPNKAVKTTRVKETPPHNIIQAKSRHKYREIKSQNHKLNIGHLDAKKTNWKDIISYVEKVIDCGGYGCLEWVLRIINETFEYTNTTDIIQFVSRTWREIEELKSSNDYLPCMKEFVNLITQKAIIVNSDFNNIIILYCSKIIEYGLINNSPLYYLVHNNQFSLFIEEQSSKKELNHYGHIVFIVSEILLFSPVPKKDQRIADNLALEILNRFGEKCYNKRHHFNYEIQYQALNLLSKIDDNNVLTTLTTFIRAKIDNTFKTRFRYHGNSQIHRTLQTALQHLLYIRYLKLIENENYEDVDIEWSLDLLGRMPHQPSVRVSLEWHIALHFYRKKTELDQNLLNLLQSRNVPLMSQMTILYWIIKRRMLTSCDEKQFHSVMRMLLSHTMGQMFNIRLLAQYLSINLHNGPPSPQCLSAKSIYDYIIGVINKTLEDNATDKNLIKLKEDYFINEFDIVRNLTPFFIYNTLPRLCEVGNNEGIDTKVVLKMMDKIKRQTEQFITPDFKEEWMKDHKLDEEFVTLERYRHVNKKTHEDLEVLGTIQKKYIPWKSMSDINVYNVEKKRESRSDLIVVASLIDKLPNLGGMARTSEVFGVKTYVVDSLRHLQDRQFQGLSVSAERWIDVQEVRPGSPLKEYLKLKKAEGYSVVAAEQTSTSSKLQNFKFPRKTLLLLGHEKEGIPCDLLPMMDHCVEIPQQGFVRSLNVHVTAAIFVWEYARQNIL